MSGTVFIADSTPTFRVLLPAPPANVAFPGDLVEILAVGGIYDGEVVESYVLTALDCVRRRALVTVTPAVADATYEFRARLRRNGSTSASSAVLIVRVDTDAPDAPVLALHAADDEGGGQTVQPRPRFILTLPGDAEAGDTAVLSFDDLEDPGVVLAAGDILAGAIEIRSAAVLSTGPHAVFGRITDRAGNEGTASNVVGVELLAAYAAAIATSGAPAGGLTVEKRLAAGVVSASQPAADLTTFSPTVLAAGVTSAGAPAGAITVEKPIAVVVDGASAPTGGLTVQKHLAAGVVSAGAVSADATIEKPLAAAAASAGTPSADLQVRDQVLLAAALESSGAPAGGLTVEKPLNAAVASSSAPAAALTVDKRLAAAIGSASGPAAALTVDKRLAVAVASSGAPAAVLSIERALAAAIASAGAPAAVLTEERRLVAVLLSSATPAALLSVASGPARKVELLVQASKVAGAAIVHADTPVFIPRACLPAEICSPTDPNRAQADGGDLRAYADQALTQRLSLQVVAFGHDSAHAAGDANVQLWVKRSLDSDVDTPIWLAWKTGVPSSQPAAGDAFGSQSVWRAAYRAVYHLDEATGELKDSTANANHAAAQGAAATYGAAGKVGKGVDFPGGGSHFARADNASLDVTAGLTIRTWIKRPATPSTTSRGILAKYRSQTGFVNQRAYAVGFALSAADISFYLSTDGTLQIGNIVTTTTAPIGTAVPHSVVCRFNPSVRQDVLVDNVSAVAKTASVAAGIANSAAPLWVGHISDSTNNGLSFVGGNSEAQIIAEAMSNDLLTTLYNNESDPASFVVAGVPQAVADDITLAAAIASQSALAAPLTVDKRLAAAIASAGTPAAALAVDHMLAAAIASAGAPAGALTVEKRLAAAIASAGSPGAAVTSTTTAVLAARFPGTFVYYTRVTAPAGIADSDEGTVRFAFRKEGSNGVRQTVLCIGAFVTDETSYGLLVEFTAANKLRTIARQADGTLVFEHLSTTAFAVGSGVHHALLTWSGNVATLEIDGVAEGANTPGTAGAVDLTDKWQIGRQDDPANRNYLYASLGEIYVNDEAITNGEIFYDAANGLVRPIDQANVGLLLEGLHLRKAFNNFHENVAGTGDFVPVGMVGQGAALGAYGASLFNDQALAAAVTSAGAVAGDLTVEEGSALTLPMVAFYPDGANNDNGWGLSFGNPGPFGVDSPYNCASFWIMRRPGSTSPPDTDASLGGIIAATSSGSFSVTSGIRVKGDTGNKWKIASSIGSRQIFSTAEIPDDGVPHHVAVSHHIGLTESIVNGSFATNSDWVYNANGSTAFAYATDHAHFDGTAGTHYLEQQTLAADLVEGTRYRINYTLSNIAGGAITSLVLKGHGAAGADVTLTATAGAKTVEWTQGPTNLTKLSIAAVASGVTFDIDSISVADIVECIRIDRAASSVSRSGVQAAAPDTTRPTGIFCHGEGAKRLIDGALGELIFNIGREFIDFNSDTNLDRVIDTNGKAVDVGANGAGWSPTSTTPAMYYTGTAQQMMNSRGNIGVSAIRASSDPAGKFSTQMFTLSDVGVPIAAAHASKTATYLPRLPNFNGTSSRYYTLNCSTLSNGKNFAFMIWVNPDRANGTQEFLLDTEGNGFSILRQTGGLIQIIGRNAAGATILDATFTGLTQNQTAVYHLSGNMADAGSFKVIKNGSALTPTVATYTDDTLKFDVTNMCIGATQAGANWYDGGLSIWMWAAHADLDAAAIAKMLTAVGSGGKPNFDRATGMGDLGESVFGAAAVFAIPFADGDCQLQVGTLAANPTNASVGTGDNAVIT